jgi:hypothetical protein
MPDAIDDGLAALAAVSAGPDLDGLEDQVLALVRARRDAAGAESLSIRAVLTLAALGLGLAFGVLHVTPRPVPLSEMGLLSEDGLLAPSMRLGGGA